MLLQGTVPFNVLINGREKEAAYHKQKQRGVRISHNSVIGQYSER